MRGHIRILRAVAVAATIVALGGGALAADSLDNSGSADSHGGGASAADHATGHVDAGSIAGSVIATLVGGSNPSTVVSQHASADEHASANVSKTADEDTDTDTDEVSHGEDVADTGTAGTKPGFGCGDKNHEHSGPPGRPAASQPPGCAKHD